MPLVELDKNNASATFSVSVASATATRACNDDKSSLFRGDVAAADAKLAAVALAASFCALDEDKTDETCSDLVTCTGWPGFEVLTDRSRSGMAEADSTLSISVFSFERKRGCETSPRAAGADTIDEPRVYIDDESSSLSESRLGGGGRRE
jgi:hypothetical protein